jgi:hypothetical protein
VANEKASGGNNSAYKTGFLRLPNRKSDLSVGHGLV